jgi:hypothetical protein
MKHEEARQAMLQAATVWDQLADLAERQVDPAIEVTLPRRRPQL